MEELDTDEYIRRIKALNAIKDQYEFTTSIQVTYLYDDETLQLTLLEILVTSGHHPLITDQCRILQPFIVFKARISPDLLLWNFLREEEFSNEADTFIRSTQLPPPPEIPLSYHHFQDHGDGAILGQT